MIDIFTDGSCHTQELIGAWAAIIIDNGKEICIENTQPDTTHNRMELLAVIKALEYVFSNKANVQVKIYSDSQYVCDLPARHDKLTYNNFLTKKGTPIQNYDLVEHFYSLISNTDVSFVKIKAHQKGDSYEIIHNQRVDFLSRELVRKAVLKIRSNGL